MLNYLVGRLDELSTWVAIVGAILAVLFIPKGLLAFSIIGTAIALAVLPDSKFSSIVKKIGEWIR